MATTRYNNYNTIHNNNNHNIIINHDFSNGLHSWQANFCQIQLLSSNEPNNNSGSSSYIVLKNRTQPWQGLEQEITDRINPETEYTLSASVRVRGCTTSNGSRVQATVRLEFQDSLSPSSCPTPTYVYIGSVSACEESWRRLEGKFVFGEGEVKEVKRVVVYLEGPEAGVDLLVDSFQVFSSCSTNLEEIHEDEENGSLQDGDDNIIVNPNFQDGLTNWSGRGCKILVHDSMGDGKILPLSGKYFASATEREQNWNGIQQDITARVQRKSLYLLSAVVRIVGGSTSDVQATLWVQTTSQWEQYIGIGKVQATDKDWAQLQGKFLINGVISKAVFYLEGPPVGIDILLNSLVIKHAPKPTPSQPPVLEDPGYGVNILENSSLENGLNPWFALGSCVISVSSGAPLLLPLGARESLGLHEPLNGSCILATKRTETWMGPAQVITSKLKLFLTYQVSAWVRVSSVAAGPQNVAVALGVDNQWVNGGQVEVNEDRWFEIRGSFRIEMQPKKVMVYIQGPSPNVDLMVAGLQIFPVDRKKRFKHLKLQTDKVRKRDVTLKISSSSETITPGSQVRIKQIQNSFPIGCCINRSSIDNEELTDFFVKNFNWAVFGNELKWYYTEAQQGNLKYKDADALLEFCRTHGIETRGHCIFWEVDGAVQQWVKSLNNTDLMTAVQSRLNSLLTRYNGKFRHYDVNNEMLHGSFYQDKLGKDIRANMFKTAHQLDQSATLFVNDYHVEDGCDTRSSPEKYIHHIMNLQDQGAPVGGIGVQGHIDNPVGAVVHSALDELGVLGLPIWITEFDVSSVNEYVRADDLEVMLRDCFAHPAVGGIMFWGFWELECRNNGHLVEAEGEVNEAGKRYLDLKEEWLTHSHGHVDEQSQFSFRGFHGSYSFEVHTPSKKLPGTFVVDKGESPVVITVSL